MIPIRDTIRPRSIPVVNHLLIAVNGLVFLVQLTQGAQLERFVFTYGLVPARFTNPELAAYFGLAGNLLSLLTFMFLHGGFWHILGNMWSLHIFGDNVEDRLGPLRYLVFYLACGWVSGLAHMLLNPSSPIPTIGASGAIAGVMGAYFVLFPTSKILTLIPIVFIPWFVEIPAVVFLGIWFLLQFLNAAGSHGAATGIAWWAHVGGFVGGIVLLKLATRLPQAGFSRRLRAMTPQKTSHRLQLVRPQASPETPHIFGGVRITPFEALAGVRKIVSIPSGFSKRTVRVTIPPGTQDGTTLRLRGLGRRAAGGEAGDLFLKVEVERW